MSCYDLPMTNIMDTPGKRLGMLRKAKGLTQTALAAAVNLKPTIISRLENDDVEPSIGSIERIAKELGATIDWLRCMPGTTIDKWWAGSASPSTGLHTPEGEEAAILIDGVPDDARRKCLDAVRSQIADYMQRREENERIKKELVEVLGTLGIDKGKIEEATQVLLSPR